MIQTRGYLAALTIVIAATVAHAQEETPVVSLRRQVNEATNEYSRATVTFDDTVKKQLPPLNASINQLTTQREPLEAKTEFFNNVTSLRKKDDLDRWVAESRKRWDAESGPRIGIVNPYDAGSFYRYYSEEKRDADGKLIEGGDLVTWVVKGDYEMLEQQRTAWDQSYKRAKDAADTLNNDYKAVVAQYGKVMAIKAQLAEAERRERDDRPGTPRLPIPETGRFEVTSGGRDIVIPGEYHFITRSTRRFNTLEEVRSWFQRINDDPSRWRIYDTQTGNSVTLDG